MFEVNLIFLYWYLLLIERIDYIIDRSHVCGGHLNKNEKPYLILLYSFQQNIIN